MKKASKYLIILSIFTIYACNSSDSKDDKEIEKEYQLVWEDEFNEEGNPDATKWNYENGYVRNNEKQFYTENLKNARVENGYLVLEAVKEEIEGYNYSSGSITTSNLVAWQYGKIEIKAKLPKGVGIWPAIWMLGENWKQVSWPKCGEIDIMEHVGFTKDSIYGTVHTEAYNHNIGTAVGKAVFINNPYDQYHIYAVEWTSKKIDFLLDNDVYHSFKNENKTDAEWPFDQKFHLKLNIAVGGGWGGTQGIDDSIFPQQMLVDYVRVYQKTN
ncbi:glycoside hydrolase family 16 protein [Aureibaculum luteum]|uniref:glycoside hydrolase family 16 protein n=1 Tax=Aureibaculum luteum TaxID=1548456 RepID=UPI000E4FF93B|nr:glycoside hydrolase family 16 protein [Aureibaculum luteum]